MFATFMLGVLIFIAWGGIIALVLTVIYLVARKVLSFKEAMACVPKGFVAMVPPIIILTLAVSLKAMINSLGADVYVYNLMFAASEWLYSMLPAVIFVVACILAFASGTSWGTFGILIPIVTAVFPADSTLLIIGISACCAGAVCGEKERADKKGATAQTRGNGGSRAAPAALRRLKGQKVEHHGRPAGVTAPAAPEKERPEKLRHRIVDDRRLKYAQEKIIPKTLDLHVFPRIKPR